MDIYKYIPGEKISHSILPPTRVVERKLVVEDLGPIEPTPDTTPDTYKRALLREQTIANNVVNQELLHNWYLIQSEITSLYKEYNELEEKLAMSENTSESIGESSMDSGDDIPIGPSDTEIRMKAICRDSTTGLLPDLIAKRDRLEEITPWLKELRIDDGDLSKIPEIVYVEELHEELANKVIRHERNITCRDLETTAGDIAKMSSLIFSMVATIYNSMTEAQKNRIPADRRAVIEHAIAMKAKTTTRADKQVSVLGLDAITKLFDREREIAEIIDKHKPEITPLSLPEEPETETTDIIDKDKPETAPSPPEEPETTDS